MATAQRRAELAVTRRITKAQREQFLEHVADGLLRPDAARAVAPSLTGSMFRSLCNRDAQFNERYAAALELGRHGRRDRLRNGLWDRAFAPDLPGSTRCLIVLAEAELPELEHRKRQRIEHTGEGGGPLRIDTGKLTDEQLDQVLVLLEQAKPE